MEDLAGVGGILRGGRRPTPGRRGGGTAWCLAGPDLPALESDAENVSGLLSNDAENGIFDILFNYLEETTSISGFLNERSRAGGSIANQIDLLNGQIERVERRVELREARLRQQFANLETVVNSLQSQSTSLATLATGLGGGGF